jgi:hypothetical protein
MAENDTLVITVAQYNFGYSIPFVCLDADGVAYDISGLTMSLIIWKYRDVGDVLLTGTIAVDVAALGTCHYPVVEHDLDIAGTYQCIVQGEDAGVTRLSWGPATLIVKPVPHT